VFKRNGDVEARQNTGAFSRASLALDGGGCNIFASVKPRLIWQGYDNSRKWAQAAEAMDWREPTIATGPVRLGNSPPKLAGIA
jgi:hypothetical protein